MDTHVDASEQTKPLCTKDSVGDEMDTDQTQLYLEVLHTAISMVDLELLVALWQLAACTSTALYAHVKETVNKATPSITQDMGFLLDWSEEKNPFPIFVQIYDRECMQDALCTDTEAVCKYIAAHSDLDFYKIPLGGGRRATRIRSASSPTRSFLG